MLQLPHFKKYGILSRYGGFSAVGLGWNFLRCLFLCGGRKLLFGNGGVRALLLLGLFLSSPPLQAQEPRVQVLDLIDRQPVPGVTVRSEQPRNLRAEQTSLVFYTDPSGWFKLNAHWLDTDTFKFQRSNYEWLELPMSQIRAQGYRVYLKRLPGPYWVSPIVQFQAFKRSMLGVAYSANSGRGLESLPAGSMGDLLRKTGFAQVQKSNATGGSPVLRGFEGNKVQLVLDGVRMNLGTFSSRAVDHSKFLDVNTFSYMEVVEGPTGILFGPDGMGGMLEVYSPVPKFSKEVPGNERSGTDRGAFAYDGQYGIQASPDMIPDGSEKVPRPNPIEFNGTAQFRVASASQERTASAQWELGGKNVAWLGNVSGSAFGAIRVGEQGMEAPGAGPLVDGVRMGPGFGRDSFYVDRQEGRDVLVRNAAPLRIQRSDWSRLHLYQLLRLRNKEKHGADLEQVLSFRYNRISEVSHTDQLALIRADDSLPVFGEARTLPSELWLGSYRLYWRNENDFFDQFRLLASAQGFNEGVVTRTFQVATEDRDFARVQSYGIRADFWKRVRLISSLDYGVEVNHQRLQSEALIRNSVTGMTAPLQSRFPDGGSYLTDFSAFVSGSRPFGNQVKFVGGLRVGRTVMLAQWNEFRLLPFLPEDFRAAQNTASARLALSGRLPGTLEIQGTISTGYRPPNPNDLGMVRNSVSGQVVAPNIVWEPEYVTMADLEVKPVFWQRKVPDLSLTIRGWAGYYRSFLVQAFDSWEGRDTLDFFGVPSRVSSLRNLQRGWLYGFRVSGSYTLGWGLRIHALVRGTRGQDLYFDAPAPGVQPVHGVAGIRLRRPRYILSSDVFFSGAKKLDRFSPLDAERLLFATETGLPAYWVWNIRGEYGLGIGWLLQFGVENILDRHYRTFGSGISEAGRDFYLGLKVRF